MNAKKFSDAMGELNGKYIEEAVSYKKESRKYGWIKSGAVAACFCFAVVTILLAANAYAANNNDALLSVDTVPPNGLSLTIVDSAPYDAEFLITNDSEFQVRYGKANRIEQYNEGNWVEITTESAGIFPSTAVVLQPGHQMYGMCAWGSKNLTLEKGTYRYLLVVDVLDTDSGTYPVVLKAKFEIQ